MHFLEMHLQLEDKSGVTTKEQPLVTLVTIAYLFLEAAGSSRKGLVPACCWLMARTEKKSNLLLSPWVTSPAHPESTVCFSFKCLIKYQYATKYFTLSLSIAVNTSHFSAQSKGFVLRKIWHQGLFEYGQRGSFGFNSH